MRLDGIKSFIVISDTHGAKDKLKSLLGVFNAADALIFLGDGLCDLSVIENELTVPLIKVRGNCDLKAAERERVLEIGNHRFLLTHGDAYGVKRERLGLYYRALELKCDYALYGHTHLPEIEVEQGVTLINPGTLRSGPFLNGSYCVVYEDRGQFAAKIIFV